MNQVNQLNDGALDCVSGGMDSIPTTNSGPLTSQPGPTNPPGGPTCPNGPVKDQSALPKKSMFSL